MEPWGLPMPEAWRQERAPRSLQGSWRRWGGGVISSWVRSEQEVSRGQIAWRARSPEQVYFLMGMGQKTPGEI